MSRRSLFLLAPLAAVALTACGGKSDDGGDIQGVPITGSSYRGMILSAINVDPSVRTSRIYYYDFSSGDLKEVLPAESGNPAVFYADGKAFVFNRDADQKSVRTFDPSDLSKAPTDALSLSALEDGDPWDVVSLVTGKSLVLATPLGGGLKTIDYTSGALVDVAGPAAGLASGGFRPHALMRTGNKIFALHAGVAANGDSDESSQVYTLTADDTGALAFSDENTATAVIDGAKIPGDNPTGFVNRDSSGGATVVSLCLPEWTNCQAGAARVADGGVATMAFSGGTPPVYYNAQVVDGPSDTVVYAHVAESSDQYKLVKLDLQAGTETDIATFADERPYGIAYDRTSGVLMVGGIDGLRGSLTLYRNDSQIGSFELDGLLYNSAFVSN